MSALTDEQLSAIWIDDRTNNEKHDCVSYARAVIAADRALRGQPVAWIDKHELAMIPLWPDEPTVSAQPVSEYDVPLYASPTIPEGYALVPIEPSDERCEAGLRAADPQDYGVCGAGCDIRAAYKALIEFVGDDTPMLSAAKEQRA